MTTDTAGFLIERLGLLSHESAWQRMRDYTDARDETTADALWQCEHPPVFTLGQAGREEHVLNPGEIPLVNTDRGGQVTYHGPGQIIVYTLVDLRRRGYGIRDLVTRLENAVMALLADYNVTAASRRDAPGVYVSGAKIAALGLRVRRGCSYHGLALNVDVDLSPFSRINPCGYKDMPVTRTVDLGISDSKEILAEALVRHVATALAHTPQVDEVHAGRLAP